MRALRRCWEHRAITTTPPLCGVCRRIATEYTLMRATVDALLAAGYELNVSYGLRDDEHGDPLLPQFVSDRATVCDLLAEWADEVETDDDYLLARRRGALSWVHFVYGLDDGSRVIESHTPDLVYVLAPGERLAERIER